MAIEKIKILPVFEVNGLDWQCYLAGSSKTAPRILIFSIAIGADYSFDIKSGFSIAPAFSLHKNFDIASVQCILQNILVIDISFLNLLWQSNCNRFFKTNIIESAGPQVEERRAAKLQKGGREGDVCHSNLEKIIIGI